MLSAIPGQRMSERRRANEAEIKKLQNQKSCIGKNYDFCYACFVSKESNGSHFRTIESSHTMTVDKTNTKDIDKFIAGFPMNIQKLLVQLRTTIKKAAPNAEEGIGYGMPAYKTNGKPLVYFSAFKNHIGFYPTPSGIEAFKKELLTYEGAKGSIKFSMDQPLPLALITKIVKFRVKENLQKRK